MTSFEGDGRLDCCSWEREISQYVFAGGTTQRDVTILGFLVVFEV